MKRTSIIHESIIVLLFSVFIGFAYTYTTGKGFFAEKHSSTARSSAAAAEWIDLFRARELHAAGNALFIDSRHEHDYRLGHIAGAYNLPLADFDAHTDYIDRLSKDRPIVTYCDGAQCNSSIELAAILQSRGFSKVYVFFGGWNEWKNRHYPTEGSLE